MWWYSRFLSTSSSHWPSRQCPVICTRSFPDLQPLIRPPIRSLSLGGGRENPYYGIQSVPFYVCHLQRCCRSHARKCKQGFSLQQRRNPNVGYILRFFQACTHSVHFHKLMLKFAEKAMEEVRYPVFIRAGRHTCNQGVSALIKIWNLRNDTERNIK